MGGILSFIATSHGLETPLLTFHVFYILGSSRADQDEENLLLFDLPAPPWPEIRAVKVGPISVHLGYATFTGYPLRQVLTDLHGFDIYR